MLICDNEFARRSVGDRIGIEQFILSRSNIISLSYINVVQESSSSSSSYVQIYYKQKGFSNKLDLKSIDRA